MQKKIWLKIAIFAFVYFFGCASAQAAGVTISPPKFEFTLNPGQTVTGEIKVVNNEKNELKLVSEVQDFIAGSGETGQPQFIDPAKNDASISLGRWVNVADKEFSLKAGETKLVKFTITVPMGAEPGGHYGTIFFSPPAGAGQIAIIQKIGALALVRVAGEVKEKGNLETFGTYVLARPDTFEGAQAKNFYEKFPINFVVRYRNDGNVHLKPQGKIEITNLFGQKLKQIGVESVVNSEGVVMDQKLVDYLPVNDAKGNVLAKSIRLFTTEYKGQAYWYQYENGSKEVKYKGFPVGRYTAKLTFAGAGGEAVTQETSFIIFPWKIIFGYGLFVIVVAFGLLKLNKWRHKKLREQIKRELTKEMKKK